MLLRFLRKNASIKTTNKKKHVCSYLIKQLFRTREIFKNSFVIPGSTTRGREGICIFEYIADAKFYSQAFIRINQRFNKS